MFKQNIFFPEEDDGRIITGQLISILIVLFLFLTTFIAACSVFSARKIVKQRKTTNHEVGFVCILLYKWYTVHMKRHSIQPRMHFAAFQGILAYLLGRPLVIPGYHASLFSSIHKSSVSVLAHLHNKWKH